MGDPGRAARGAAGNPELRELIGEHTVRLCRERFGDALRSIVLTGSVARDEGTATREGGRRRVLGDAELILLFREGSPVPGKRPLEAFAGTVESSLERAGVLCRVDLAPVRENYFRRLPPSIFAFELRACGKVLWGEDAPALIPVRVGEGVPPGDAFRLLWNRIIELFGAVGTAAEGEPAPIEANYAAAKLCLDAATSFLVFAGLYEPSYRARRERFHELAAEGAGNAAWPFPPMEFLDRLDRCTEWKLSGEGAPGGWNFCEEVMGYARSLARWELVRITGCPAETETERLWTVWRRAQLLSGARGWLYVMRARGWGRGWKQWPRWFRMALGGSPRAWIYRAADELPARFALPPRTQPGNRRVAKMLPCPRPAQGADFKNLCRAVFANYKEFLVGTRC